ncbi:MAG TPA: iron-sulfur cluster assembly accessory protein [Gemmata sp.]|jgi:iron-sulfur cluster assembly protein|nr:iron-sulfur cluster assembly accessory protein [Gemmata sp.]
MATAVANETETQGLGLKDAPPSAQPLTVTEKAATEVKRHIADMQASGQIEPGSKLYLRVRVQGGGCSGFQNKLDLDAKFDEKTDHKIEYHGIEVVVDKRSMLYLAGAVVDFHDDLNKRGFTVTNPSAKSTCGCGSSYSM